MALDPLMIKEKFFKMINDDEELCRAFNFNRQKAKFFPEDDDPNKVVLKHKFEDADHMRFFLTTADKPGFDITKKIEGNLGYKLKSIGVTDEDLSKLTTSEKLKYETVMYAIESEESDKLSLEYKNKLDSCQKLINQSKNSEDVIAYKRKYQEDKGAYWSHNDNLVLQIKCILRDCFNERPLFNKYLTQENLQVEKSARDIVKDDQETLEAILLNLKQLSRDKGFLDEIRQRVRDCESSFDQKIHLLTDKAQPDMYGEDREAIDAIDKEVQQFKNNLEKINNEIIRRITTKSHPNDDFSFSTFISKLSKKKTNTLTSEERIEFKSILEILLEDKNLPNNPPFSIEDKPEHNGNYIDIRVEKIGSRVLVCFVQYVNLINIPRERHQDRIKELVLDVLKQVKIPNATFESVYVSACAQVNDGADGQYANAFVKCPGENTLSRWEPKDGSELYSNNSICDMVIDTVTAQFEHGVRRGIWDGKNSYCAEQQTLKHKRLNEAFRTAQYAHGKTLVMLHVGIYRICLAVTKAFQKFCRSIAKNKVSVSDKGYFKDNSSKIKKPTNFDQSDEITENASNRGHKPK